MAYVDTILLLQAITLAVVLALAYSLRRILILERSILRVEKTLLNIDKKIAGKSTKKKKK